jgi:hypothetical protein
LRQRGKMKEIDDGKEGEINMRLMMRNREQREEE